MRLQRRLCRILAADDTIQLQMMQAHIPQHHLKRFFSTLPQLRQHGKDFACLWLLLALLRCFLLLLFRLLWLLFFRRLFLLCKGKQMDGKQQDLEFDLQLIFLSPAALLSVRPFGAVAACLSEASQVPQSPCSPHRSAGRGAGCSGFGSQDRRKVNGRHSSRIMAASTPSSVHSTVIAAPSPLFSHALCLRLLALLGVLCALRQLGQRFDALHPKAAQKMFGGPIGNRSAGYLQPTHLLHQLPLPPMR